MLAKWGPCVAEVRARVWGRSHMTYHMETYVWTDRHDITFLQTMW